MIYVFEKLVIFLFLLREIFSMLIFLFVRLLHWFFSSFETIFVHGISYTLIFCSRNVKLLCFSPYNLLHVGFSSRDMILADFWTWNLLLVDYFSKKLFVSWFMSLKNLLYLCFFFMKLVVCWYYFRGTCISIFLLVKPVLFVELWMCWFSFVKLNLSWYFSS